MFLLTHSREIQHSYPLIRKLLKRKKKQPYSSESNLFEKCILELLYYVDLYQILSVQVSLHTSDPSLVVFLHICRAFPMSDFASPIYDLRVDGIEMRLVRYIPYLDTTGDSSLYLKWLRSVGFVYLQCKVLICDNSHHQSRFNQSCVSGRKRDISSYKRKTNSVVAPIHLKREVQVESQDFRVKCMQKKLRNNLLTVCLCFVHGPRFGCCDVAVIIGRHSVNQRTDYKHQKLQDY